MEEFDSTLLEQYFRLHRLLMHGLHERRGCARTAYSGQGRVLKLLRIKPEISQREMAEILGIRPQSLGETLNRLMRLSQVNRRASITLLARFVRYGLAEMRLEDHQFHFYPAE